MTMIWISQKTVEVDLIFMCIYEAKNKGGPD